MSGKEKNKQKNKQKLDWAWIWILMKPKHSIDQDQSKLKYTWDLDELSHSEDWKKNTHKNIKWVQIKTPTRSKQVWAKAAKSKS